MKCICGYLISRFYATYLRNSWKLDAREKLVFYYCKTLITGTLGLVPVSQFLPKENCWGLIKLCRLEARMLYAASTDHIIQVVSGVHSTLPSSNNTSLPYWNCEDWCVWCCSDEQQLLNVSTPTSPATTVVVSSQSGRQRVILNAPSSTQTHSELPYWWLPLCELPYWWLPLSELPYWWLQLDWSPH